MYGTYDLKKGVLKVQQVEYKCYENSKVIAYYEGTPSNLFNVLLECANLNTDWMNAFISPFLLILYYKVSKELLITQHLFGNGKNLYFHKENDKIYMTSTLLELKNLCNMTYCLNIPMLSHYLYNGFIAQSHTLIAGIRKLEAGVYYIINRNGIQKFEINIEPKDGLVDSIPEYDALEVEYKYALSNSISNLINNTNGPTSIALSSGFDSNCILHGIKMQWPEKEILAFSVGGIRGIDETVLASKISSTYDKVHFITSLVSNETFQNLDEIVSILDGSVYERGIFLQYELAKLINVNGVSSLICGECADQVFHQNTYKRIPSDTFLFGYSDTPYQMAVYAVLRKNSLMMNAFGIKTSYPFLTPQMIKIGSRSRNLNGSTKEFHKSQCNKMLPKNILRLIGKQGGSTDLSALFPENFDCSKVIHKCKYYSKDFMLTKKYDFEESVRDYYLSLLFLESFEKQFCDLIN